MAAGVGIETVRDLPHVWVGREAIDGGGYQYVKRWKNCGMPWAEYWPVREHSLLVRLAEREIRHVVEVIGIDGRLNEVRTWDAGVSLDRLDRRIEVRGEHAPHPHPFFAIAELLKLMRWALVALEEIHRLGLVHCDLNSGNICVPVVTAGDGWQSLDYSRLKLIDFAFALHRDLPLKYPLPVDTADPDLFFLPPFFRDAIARDQRENRPTHGQRLMTPGIDLYSLGMITQVWYRAGFRPHARISAAAVEALFRRLASHGREGPWRDWFLAGGGRLIRAIDRMLQRADTDPCRSVEFRFLAAESVPAHAGTAITPLLTRVLPPAPPAPSPAASRPALLRDPVPAGAPRRATWPTAPRMPAALLLFAAALGAALYPAGLRFGARLSAGETPGAPPPGQGAATALADPEQWWRALASPNAGERSESARALARLARTAAPGTTLADLLAQRFIVQLHVDAATLDAPRLHAAAWAALSALADQADEPPDQARPLFVTAAIDALAAYEARTEDLHRRLGGLIYNRRAQAAEPDWNDYVLHLRTLADAAAHAGSARGALLLGLIEAGNGREADGFRHLRQALLRGEERRAAGDEIGRLLQKLVDSGNRQTLATVIAEVEEMAAQRNPAWQVWAARINDVLGDEGKAASWYRQVSENRDAGSAEIDFARGEMARLTARR